MLTALVAQDLGPWTALSSTDGKLTVRCAAYPDGLVTPPSSGFVAEISNRSPEAVAITIEVEDRLSPEEGVAKHFLGLVPPSATITTCIQGGRGQIPPIRILRINSDAPNQHDYKRVISDIFAGFRHQRRNSSATNDLVRIALGKELQRWAQAPTSLHDFDALQRSYREFLEEHKDLDATKLDPADAAALSDIRVLVMTRPNSPRIKAGPDTIVFPAGQPNGTGEPPSTPPPAEGRAPGHAPAVKSQPRREPVRPVDSLSSLLESRDPTTSKEARDVADKTLEVLGNELLGQAIRKHDTNLRQAAKNGIANTIKSMGNEAVDVFTRTLIATLPDDPSFDVNVYYSTFLSPTTRVSTPWTAYKNISAYFDALIGRPLSGFFTP
ncbi:MAG: hypothetical protein JNL08_16285 [Planctomycetes bacterium]|nr:hypothetical protein [Planctomycetota bacterium]